MRRIRTRLPRPAAAVFLAVLALSAAIAHAQTTGGGLSVAPAIVEPPHWTPGLVGTLAISNTTTTAQQIKVTPRPWVVSSAGVATPDPHKDLTSLISISNPSFTLGAGTSQSVKVTLRKPPPGGSLYGSLVVVGIPVDAAKRPGITIGYRLISRLRLDPAQNVRKLKVSVGAPRISGKSIVLPVTNRGNTLDPIDGNASLKGPTGTRNVQFLETRIIPGTTALIGVAPASEFKSGRYTFKYQVNQTGTRVATGTTTIQLH
jgi:hypothetical protein